MDDKEQFLCGVVADQVAALGMPSVLDVTPQGIIEGCDGVAEGDAVFCIVQRGLRWVPYVAHA